MFPNLERIRWSRRTDKSLDCYSYLREKRLTMIFSLKVYFESIVEIVRWLFARLCPFHSNWIVSSSEEDESEEWVHRSFWPVVDWSMGKEKFVSLQKRNHNWKWLSKTIEEDLEEESTERSDVHSTKEDRDEENNSKWTHIRIWTETREKKKKRQSLIWMEWHNRNILFHWEELNDLHRNNSSRTRPKQFDSVEWDLRKKEDQHRQTRTIRLHWRFLWTKTSLSAFGLLETDRRWNLGESRIQYPSWEDLNWKMREERREKRRSTDPVRLQESLTIGSCSSLTIKGLSDERLS